MHPGLTIVGRLQLQKGLEKRDVCIRERRCKVAGYARVNLTCLWN